MNRIKRVSLFFRILFQIVFIGMPLLLIVGWVTSPDSLVMLGGMINMRFIPPAYTIMHVLSNGERLLGFGISAVPMLVELYIVYLLIKLFKHYEKGDIFSVCNVQYIHSIGYALLAGQVINPFYQGLMGVALTWHNPHGHRYATVTLDQANVGVILMALLVILISWIMAEGYKLREEQQLTI